MGLLTLKECINIRGKERIFFFFLVCILISALVAVVDKRIESQTQLTSDKQRELSVSWTCLRALDVLGCLHHKGTLLTLCCFIHSNSVQSFQVHFLATTLEENQLPEVCPRRLIPGGRGGGVFTWADLNNRGIFFLKFSSASFQIKNPES